ncbi:hypothetical protein [Cupriavidus sp. RAF12]
MKRIIASALAPLAICLSATAALAFLTLCLLATAVLFGYFEFQK